MSSLRHFSRFAGCVLLIVVCPVLAQSRFIEEYPIEPIQLQTLKGSLFFESRYREDNDDRQRGGESHSTDLLLREGADVQLGGYIYHPNLIDWRAAFRAGLSQQEINRSNNAGTIRDEQQNSDGVILGYDLSARILREKPLSGRVFANWTQDTIDRSFARSIDIENRSEGLELFYRGRFPMSLLFEHRTTREEDETRIDDEDIYYLRYEISDERDPDWLTRLVYEHEDIDGTSQFIVPDSDRTLTSELPDRRDEINLTNRWLFGPGERKHSLIGQLRAQHRTGIFENNELFLDEQLTLSHDKTFSTFYRGLVNVFDASEQSETRLRADVGLEKQFYASLLVRAWMEAENRDYTDGSDDRLGGFLDLDYNKHTPIGEYHSSLRLSREYEREQTDGGQRRILNEAVSLRGLQYTALREPSVMQSTLVVTDVRNLITYVAGIDYQIRQTGTFTEISRLVGGAIDDGETVLVDYSIDTARDQKFHTDELFWRHRIDLNDIPLAIYFEYRMRDEIADSGVTDNLDRLDAYLAGAELTLGEFSLNGEYETLKQRLFASWTAYRTRATYTHQIDTNLSMSLTGYYEMLNYLDAEQFGLTAEQDFLESYGITANANTKLSRSMLLRLDGRYTKRRGRDNDTLGRIGASLLWNFGQVEFSLDSHYEIYEQEQDSGDSVFVGMNLRRWF